MLNLYRVMCIDIGIKVWEKLIECKKSNPGFDPKDEEHFRRAMRELAIYDFKVEYLQKKGFKAEWGCPNFVLFHRLRSSSSSTRE
jgi:hypothetical protein